LKEKWKGGLGELPSQTRKFFTRAEEKIMESRLNKVVTGCAGGPASERWRHLGWRELHLGAIKSPNIEGGRRGNWNKRAKGPGGTAGGKPVMSKTQPPVRREDKACLSRC